MCASAFQTLWSTEELGLAVLLEQQVSQGHRARTPLRPPPRHTALGRTGHAAFVFPCFDVRRDVIIKLLPRPLRSESCDSGQDLFHRSALIVREERQFHFVRMSDEGTEVLLSLSLYSYTPCVTSCGEISRTKHQRVAVSREKQLCACYVVARIVSVVEKHHVREHGQLIRILQTLGFSRHFLKDEL